MASPKEKEQRFDQVKLQGMHEPLTVRVEKMRGNVRQPIELPPKGSEQQGFSPPGTGWTRDEVLQLENFILTKWSGGGYYEFTVTDAKGDRMTWQGVWDPRLYPEKIPPNTAEAAMYGAAPPPVAGPQNVPVGSQPLGFQQQTGWPPSGNSLGYNNPPHTGPVMAPQQPPQAPAPAMAPAPQQPPQAPPMWAPQAWNANPTQPPWNGPQPWGYTPTPGFQPGYGQPPYGPQMGYPPPPPPYGYGGRASRFQDDELGARRARFFDDDDKEKRETERRENEKRDLEGKLRQAELNHKEMEYKAMLDRIQQQQTQQLQQVQQQHALQMQTLQEELRRIGEGRNKGEDDEVRRAREEATRIREAQQAEMQRLREQAQAEQAALQRQLQEQQLMQMRASSDAQVALLRDQLARMAEAPKGETDEFRRLRDEQDRQAREFERQRLDQERRLETERAEQARRLETERAERERERERYDRERREEQLAREMREQAAATERRFEQLAASRNQNDPMIDAMKENARMNAEQMREIARMQNDSTNRMSQFMVAPMQLAQIMKDNSSGSDGLMKNVVDSVGGIVNMYKNAAETIMQMSGGGGEPPAVRLIQEGIGRASEVAERFLAVKRDSVISEAKVKTAEAQRDQTKIQADAALRVQAMHAQAQAQQRQWAPPPPLVANTNGLGGVQQQGQQRPQRGQPQQPAQAQQPQAQSAQAQQRPAANGQPKQAGPIDDQVPAPVQPKRTGPIDDQVPDPPVVHSTGPTEEEVFGMAYESVQRLRRGVADGKLTPAKTVDAILQGVEHVVTNNLVIPAFVLFQQERWADFVDVMLPMAPQEFKDECIRILTDEIEVGDPNEPEADAS